MLADGVIVWGVGIFVLGFLAFFIFVFAMIARTFWAVFRSIFGGGHGHEPHTAAGPANTRVACGNLRCGYLNEPGARFCARCGTPL